MTESLPTDALKDAPSLLGLKVALTDSEAKVPVIDQVWPLWAMASVNGDLPSVPDTEVGKNAPCGICAVPVSAMLPSVPEKFRDCDCEFDVPFTYERVPFPEPVVMVEPD